jgi:glycosyltransferase involved in cell wall biosynthesis
MRVFFDDRRGVYAPHTGIGRYAALCLEGLRADPRVTPVSAAARLGRFGESGIAESARIGKLVADQVGMAVRGGGVDIHHAVWQETSPLLRVPLVLTIHDLSMQTSSDTYSRFQRAYYGNLLKLLVRRAQVILTPSEATAADIDSWFPGATVQVAANPIDPIFLGDPAPNFLSGSSGLPRPYLLYTGGLHARKDLKTLLRGTAIAQKSGEFEGSLVVTGPAANPDFEELASSLGCNLTMSGVVDTAMLRDLYLNAAAVVTASFNEGFGYSAAEGIACGKAVACPDRGATAETARSAGVTFEAGNAEDLAGAIGRAAAPGSELARNVAREQRTIRERFSIRRAAEDVIRGYETALA